jgi:uncharacterized protein DUF4136
LSKRFLSLFLFLVPGVMFAADVTSDFDRDVDLSELKRFQFADQSSRLPMDALHGDDLTDKRMRNAIRDGFTSVGLYEVATRPDVIIAYYSTVAHKKQVVTSGYGRPAWWGVRSAWVEESTDGTAVVDLLDPHTGELIWRGRVSGAITLNNVGQRTRDGMQRLANAFWKDREKQARRR